MSEPQSIKLEEQPSFSSSSTPNQRSTPVAVRTSNQPPASNPARPQVLLYTNASCPSLPRICSPRSLSLAFALCSSFIVLLRSALQNIMGDDSNKTYTKQELDRLKEENDILRVSIGVLATNIHRSTNLLGQTQTARKRHSTENNRWRSRC